MMNRIARTPFSPRTGFTLTELLVVVAIVLILMALMIPVLQGWRLEAKRALAHKEVNYAKSQALQYGVDNNFVYPPDTDNYGNGETVFDPTSMYTYLGSRLSKLTNSPYILMKPAQLKPYGGGPGMLYLDPWMNPYHFDAYHTLNGDPEVPIGRPYDTAVPAAEQTADVKIWSSGPDGLESMGSHVIGVPTGVNADNIGSW